MLSITHRSARRKATANIRFRSIILSRQSALARLVSSLAVLEQREGKLQNASLSAVTAAQILGNSITGFIAGSNVKSVAEEAAKVKGLDKIIMIESGSYDKVRSPLLECRTHGGGFVFINSRASPKTMRLSWLRISKEKASRMSLPDIRLLERT